MEATRPVNSVLNLSLCQYWRASHWSSRIADTVIIKSFHDRTILLKIEPVELVLVVGLIFRRNIFNQIYVLIWVKSCQSLLLGANVIKFSELIIYRSKVIIQLIFTHYFVSHCYSQRLHWMTVGVVKCSDHVVEIVDDIVFVIHFLDGS